MYLVEQTETKLRVIVTIKTHSVPYCDNFVVVEEWSVLQLTPQSQCCVLRVTYGIHFVKSTMMRSMITSSTVSETKKSWDAFQIWVYQTNGHKFKEQKKVASKSNLNHLVEPVDSRRKKKVKTDKK